MDYCGKPITSRSRFSVPGLHRCFHFPGHTGKCEEFPYLRHLEGVATGVAKKIVRDSTMTTGAAWKSEDAGPNRIRRWAMLKSDAELIPLGINMAKLKPQVVAKLREKAASYEDCMAVAKKLTWSVYSMTGAPVPPKDIAEYLANHFGPIRPGTTTCLICAEPLNFELFAKARRGKAEIETAHSNPRIHTPENVGFAHRTCNIAQGNQTLDEFYDWIRGILGRTGRL